MVTVGPDENAMWQRRFPLVMIRPGSSIVDPTADEEPRLIQQTISVRVIQMVPGDDVGEMCMLGAHHPEIQDSPVDTASYADEPYDQSKATSSGKGLLQIEEVVIDTLKSLSPDDGVTMLCRSKGGVDAVLSNQTGYVCWRDYQFEAQLTHERTFPSGAKFRTDSVLKWSNPDRFDLLEMVVVGGGSVSAVSSWDGTGGAGDGIVTSVTTGETASVPGGDVVGLYACYDDYHATPEDRKDISPVELLK